MRFAQMKRILRLDYFRLRGLSGARDEVLLAATAQNLRRFTKLLCHAPPPRAAVLPGVSNAFDLATCTATSTNNKLPKFTAKLGNRDQSNFTTLSGGRTQEKWARGRLRRLAAVCGSR